jgi:hypothetical protein
MLKFEEPIFSPLTGFITDPAFAGMLRTRSEIEPILLSSMLSLSIY